MDIHGLSSNAAQQEGISGMRAIADSRGFLVVYPDGHDNAWNAKLCCGNRDVDDVGFIRAVVAAVAEEGNVDRSRVYVTGLSNGGAMSQRLACDAADLFAAAVPMAFPLADRPATGCQPARSMPVLTVMGLTDVLVEYDGPLGSAAATFAYWREINACRGTTPDVVDRNGASRCEYYTACANDVQVGLCSVTARAFGGTAIDGHLLYFNDDYVLAEVAWDFLSRFTLPERAAPAAEATLTGFATARDLSRKKVGKSRTVWAFRLGEGTWAARDEASGGKTLTGGWSRGRGAKRRGTLELTTPARTVLQELVQSASGGPWPGDLTGTTLEAAGPVRVRSDRRGAPLSLRGRWRILRDGAPIGSYDLRLRRAR